MRIEKAVIAVLAYHDMFDYPLTLEEITNFLPAAATRKQIEVTLKKNEKFVKSNNNYFYLKNRGTIVHTRLNRKKYSVQKFKRAILYKNILCKIPTIKLVAITGALALENSTKIDDIDLLIVTSSQTLWTTRLFANLLLWPFKRSPNTKFQANKACLNIFIDEKNMKIKDKNLYTAHEFAQMKVIYNKENTYKKFIHANKWVIHYLPNWEPKLEKQNKTHSSKTLRLLFMYIEPYAKQIQLKYMKSKITTEQIGDTQLFFHPKKTQNSILHLYDKKTKALRIDKNNL